MGLCVLKSNWFNLLSIFRGGGCFGRGVGWLVGFLELGFYINCFIWLDKIKIYYNCNLIISVVFNGI